MIRLRGLLINELNLLILTFFLHLSLSCLCTALIELNVWPQNWHLNSWVIKDTQSSITMNTNSRIKKSQENQYIPPYNDAFVQFIFVTPWLMSKHPVVVHCRMDRYFHVCHDMTMWYAFLWWGVKRHVHDDTMIKSNHPSGNHSRNDLIYMLSWRDRSGWKRIIN